MKIISYNLNGIRAAINKDLIGWLKQENPDVICFQEIKAHQEDINKAIFEDIGYNFYSVSAQKKGYSGVAILTKQKPDNIVYGIENELYDSEGRAVRVDFGDNSVLCVYVPSGSMGDARQSFKMEFLEYFDNFAQNLLKQRPNLIIAGDFNICHKEIDIHHPKKHNDISGFLPEEREWISNFIKKGFIDSFRHFNKDPDNYSWWSYRGGARQKNLGWRIDYNFVSNNLESKLQNASILSNVFHSDHCPVSLDLLIC